MQHNARLIQVTVKPKSTQQKICQNPDGTLTVYLHASPHDNAANAALVALLSKHFHVAKSRITIRQGTKSRQKLISIS